MQTNSAAESLYRFFAAFEGFDDAHPLGFEAELRTARTGERTTAPTVCAAVFSMEPTLTQVRKYIHGGRTVRGGCTVSARVRDDDGGQRRETAAFFEALAAYVYKNGARYTDGARVFVIRPAAQPARLRLTPDGAVWELRCSTEMTETTSPSSAQQSLCIDES